MAPVFAMSIMILGILAFHPKTVFGGDTGINYGTNGDNLPSAKQVIDFLTTQMSSKITLIRVEDASLEILEALSGTNLVVTIGVPNEAIPYVASSQDAADKWFQDHIVTYTRRGVRFRYLCVGNDAVLSTILASQVIRAIANLHESIRKAGIDYLFVSTAVGSGVLGASYPPSQGQFAPGVSQIMSNLTSFLYSIGSPLLINVYPFFALVSEPDHISLEYALFQSQTPVVIDGNLAYYNLFDAMVDAFLAAMVRVVGKEDVKVVVSETGWPTAGYEPFSSIENARIYNNKLREHVIGVGKTPRKADMNMEVYIFDMFNENFKGKGNFGTFYPDFRQVYPLW
ncbi:Glycoside hydrolase, family 17 [Corchorus capsularis]|uniref:glucan endo-1,3-beta-D-glucosidase n=1 Tax=Corchorus capsularis TaxID=210143 RepID=A0A1R3GT37_COCAP|nr:Glycoside hydrolase, family 17 [Corchorus capsularis]